MIIQVAIALLAVAKLQAIMWLPETWADGPIDFVRDVRPIFEQHCFDCHGPKKEESGLRLDIRSAAMRGGDNHGPDIIPGNADESPLLQLVCSEDSGEVMPPDGRLSNEQIAIIKRWIDSGANWPEGVDQSVEVDRADHWAFKPLPTEFTASSIDQFIDAKLSEQGLRRAPQAEPVVWLRRVYLDLIGLPPTPDEMNQFMASEPLDYAGTVDRLLDSQRYGERWAQHWLDVVRYADTHGFEVNTERPHAWHYRDYVIRALNADLPYDQFIQQQLCGDLLGEDVATGFLITASVLLPGQIGKDDASIRLARQDAVDEIVNNIGQTFLGLSVGCARCHDHKLDPISSKDYYSMQAFVAGVEYEDREIRSAEVQLRRQAAAPLRQQLEQITEQLLSHAPLARPNSSHATTNARENIVKFESRQAKFVRFTIDAANLHPELGLIEPCIDEFEIYGQATDDVNLALSERGTTVVASGSQTSELHQLTFVNDGRLGNARSWMSNQAGAGWLLFELEQPQLIDKIVWSRDRLGQYTDRLATAYRIEVGQQLDSMELVAQVAPPRPTIGAGRVNVDRFPPVQTNKLRFAISATNSLEPCLDEIEVFNSDGLNVALASRGTIVKTSGNKISIGQHEPQFIHDGRYGNSSSWMSDQEGQGWVELQFAEPQVVSRVLWSRDREGLLEDRLPIEYRLEVEVDGRWLLVADSSDRSPHVAGMSRGPEFTTLGLPEPEMLLVKQLLADRQRLQNQLTEAEAGQLAFAGKFRQPDKIYRLHRGDPEQPREEVLPAVIAALGKLELPADCSESDRRKELANWIASPSNPLTARVIVNRVWQGHFGMGLVETPSDFGRGGMPPSHPELLDWLAGQLIQHGWSLKSLHRQIVLSSTYCQAMQAERELTSQAEKMDAQSRWLWRFPPRRLDAEVIRDSMLQISGLINLKMFGRGFDLFNQRGGLSGFTPVEKLLDENSRRMIYAHKVRRERDVVFGALDCPDGGQSTERRRESTNPVQALNLLNSPFTVQTSLAFARRVQQEVGDSFQRQVIQTYQLALGRQPDEVELAEVVPLVAEHGLVALCRAIFNSNEFLSMP